MRHRVGKKFGDTLVEVTIAIGIFSMVAVAFVAVVSNSTSGAQSNLESTVAREEMDAQAEALRFIQNGAVSEIGGDEKKANDNTGDTAVWNAIIKKAQKPSAEILEYSPGECNKIYDGSNNDKFFVNKAFIINTRKLYTGDPKEIVVSYNKDKFTTTPTYPRLLYKNDSDDLVKVQGLYIIAVQNGTTTNIVRDGVVIPRSAYYDFYIRSCWYSSGSNAPTTISTVVRLYDPDVATKEVKPHYEEKGHYDTINFYKGAWENGVNKNSSVSGNPPDVNGNNKNNPVYVYTGNEISIPPSSYEWPGYSFTGVWCTEDRIDAGVACPTDKSYRVDQKYSVEYGATANNASRDGRPLNLYATWKQNDNITVKYDKNATDTTDPPIIANKTLIGGTYYEISKKTYTRKKFTFAGWCQDATTCDQKEMLSPGKTIKLPIGKNVTFYAQWTPKPSTTITFACGDGSVKSNANLTQTITKDNDESLRNYSEMCNDPTNYAFNYWSQSDTCSTDPKTYSNKATFSYKSECTSGVTLTAIWKQKSKVLIENGNKNSTATFNPGNYSKITITGTAKISPKTCHSMTSGSSDGIIYLKFKSGTTESSVGLYTRTFQKPEGCWTDKDGKQQCNNSHFESNETSTTLNKTITIPNGITDASSSISFYETHNGVYCVDGYGWSLSGIKVVAYP